ncbi:hypothetical protein LDENG_00282350 [Lucifuga dentata]|nr:hypothetical protein LDENG_00282350 [Lucifuga dentata]
MEPTGGESRNKEQRMGLKEVKSLTSGFKHVNDGGFQLQSNHLTMDLVNNININMPPIETKVLIIQRAWRDFLQRQDVEKRSPSPPSLSSSDKMSMSISMTTLSDGSTPLSVLVIIILYWHRLQPSHRMASAYTSPLISKPEVNRQVKS